MKFYSLSYNESSKLGDPSIQEFRDGYNYEKENSATHIQYYQKIKFIPDLDFVLDSQGKATDLMEVCSVSSDYLFVTPKFYEILMEYKLLRNQHFDGVLRDKNNLLPYHFLHFYDQLNCDEKNFIDFEKTKFFASKTTFPISIMAIPTDDEGILGEFQVDSWSEFNDLRDKVENNDTHKVILPTQTLYIKQKDILDLDLFYIDFGNYELRNFIISERLADTINKKGITGVNIESLPYEIELSE